MPATTPTWNGFKGLAEHPDSPDITTDATKTAITRIFEGPFSLCQASEPDIGQAFTDLPGDILVVGSRVQHMPGDKGRLTINFETPYETTFEIEWVEVDKPLIMNPRYADGGAKALTLADFGMIEKWEQEENPVLKFNYKYKVSQDITNPGTGDAAPTGTSTVNGITFNIYTLSVNAQDYAAKRLKGEEMYRIYAPVVRQTSESINKPDSGPCGLLQNPPGEAGAPDGYTWQETAKRITRTGPYGKYREQLEWQGADYIDPDLYGTADPSTAPDPTS